MKKETQDKTITPVKRWCVSLDWYQQYHRSFSSVAAKYLCPECRQKWGENAEIPPDDIAKALRNCCSLKPGFLTETTPVLESVFATFLAGGNQPLSAEELSRQLVEHRGGADGYRFSPEILEKLLVNDDFYGFTESP
ncbi:MAG: hypothetical protein ABID87_01860 [Chloroflexota bacterium]